MTTANLTRTSVECIELLDAHQMRAINTVLNSPRKYAEEDHLFLKIQGMSPTAMAESEALAREITAKHGGKDWMSAEGNEAESMWNDRKHAAFASIAYGGPGSKAIPTDVWSVLCNTRSAVMLRRNR